jgi:hypothetical protein
MDGTALTEQFWVYSEPNGAGECVEVSRALSGWNDMSCSPDKRNTICQALNKVNTTPELVNTTTPEAETTTDESVVPTTEQAIYNTTTELVNTTTPEAETTTDESELPSSMTEQAIKNTTTESVNSTTPEAETTTDESVLPTSATEQAIYNTTEVNITCYNYTVCGANTTLSVWELASIIARRHAELAVVKSQLSSSVRRKSSAGDSRPTSVSIGVLGGIIIVAIYMSISLLDFVPVQAKPKAKVKSKAKVKPRKHSKSSSHA